LVLAADGRTLASEISSERGTLGICEAETAKSLASVRTGAARVTPLALTSDGRQLAYLAWDVRAPGNDVRAALGVAQATGTVTTQITLPPGRIISDACFSSDGRLLAGAEGNASDQPPPAPAPSAPEIVVWETATGRERLRLAAADLGPRPCLALSPGCDQLAAVDLFGSIRVWVLATGRLAFAPLRINVRLTGLAFSPDGQRLAVVGLDNCVHMFDAIVGHELLQLRSLGHSGTGDYGFVARVAFSADGQRLAANAWDGTVSIWTATTLAPQVEAAPSGTP
jgi:WD40 repeat protein